MEFSADKVIEEGGFAARLGPKNCHYEQLTVVHFLLVDPLQDCLERDLLYLIYITIDNFHGLSILKVLTEHLFKP